MPWCLLHALVFTACLGVYCMPWCLLHALVYTACLGVYCMPWCLLPHVGTAGRDVIYLQKRVVAQCVGEGCGVVVGGRDELRHVDENIGPDVREQVFEEYA